MGASARKDYGSGANISPSNETLKQVNTMNAPFSVQATGHDKVKKNYIKVTSDNLDDLATGTRVLFGNDEGVVLSVATDVGPPVTLTSAVIRTRNIADNSVRDTTYTKQEILDASAFFLVNP